MRTTSQLLLTFLLNACWQIASVVTVAATCDWLLRKTAARFRHVLWVTALVLSLGLPVLTCAPLLRSAFAVPAPAVAPLVKPIDSQAISTAPIVADLAPPPAAAASAIKVNPILAAGIVALYFLFLLYRGAKLFRAWRRTKSIKQSAQPIDLPAPVQAIIDRCQTVIGVTRFRLLSSTSVPVPITVGIRNPLVILPEQSLREADCDVLTSAVGHELVHVWRRDYLLNLLYELIYLPLSFHPAAALVRRRINQTRELGCDDLVTEKLLGAEAYARSLVQLAGLAVPFGRPATLTVGITDADILEVRIMSLLKRPTLNPRRNRLLLIAAALLLALPCVAAASFAVRFDLGPEAALLGHQEPAQEAKQKRERELHESELKAEREREDQELKARIENEPNPEVRAKLEALFKKRQAERAGQMQGYAVTVQDREEGARAERKIAELKSRLANETNLEDRAKLETALRNVMADLEASRENTIAVQVGEGWQAERELEAERKMALASAAKITMDQAIQIASSQHPGKVLECSLVGEHWEAPGKLGKDSHVVYHVVILSGDEANPITTHVIVNALDGTILKAATEDGSRKGNLELRRKINAQP